MNKPTFEQLPELIGELIKKVDNIEKLLNSKKVNSVKDKEGFKYTPIQEIFNMKICSRPTFYNHFHNGKFAIYKFGNKSFIDMQEFNKCFHPVKL